jgi:hypothetical protein
MTDETKPGTLVIFPNPGDEQPTGDGDILHEKQRTVTAFQLVFMT